MPFKLDLLSLIMGLTGAAKGASSGLGTDTLTKNPLTGAMSSLGKNEISPSLTDILGGFMKGYTNPLSSLYTPKNTETGLGGDDWLKMLLKLLSK